MAPVSTSKRHAVRFYEDEEQLARTVADFVGAGLAAGDPALVIAVNARHSAIKRHLERRLFDVDRAMASGTLTFMDAEATLAMLMLDGEPRPELFALHIGGRIRQSRARHGERLLHAYGEMVDLLWKAGSSRAAIALEGMWNDLAKSEDFSLLCGYALGNFSASDDDAGFDQVCAAHSQVHPTESFTAIDTEDGRRREVARLQQRARALEAELQRRELLEEELRQQSEQLRERERSVRRAESMATAERQKLSELFMQSPALIVLLRGPDHVYDFVNAAARGLVGRDDAIGKPVREVLREFPPERIAILDDVFRTGNRYVEDGVRAVRDWNGDGRPYERFFNMVYEPYRRTDGTVEGIMSFGFEVTEQIRAKQKLEAIALELESAGRTKDEFLATVSHELRTPLNAILGWARMLRSSSLSPDKRERALETIERNANAQTQLIEDLLDVSRIISGKLRLDVGDVDLPLLLDNAIEAVRPAAHAKGVTLRQVMDAGVGTLLGDADRLQQVVWNLLTNAVKFTPKGGTVTVAVRQRDAAVEIAVSDDGQGIAPEFLPSVFERFRQADASTARKQGGLGLGLAIVRHLVELHGGTVEVESDGLGRGATFTVSLPVAPLRATSLQRPPPLRLLSTASFECPRELEGAHVLVVDDEPDVRELLSQLLGMCKARVTTAASTSEALQLVQDLHPDVIVSDIGMPGEDGYALIQRLRALPQSRGGRTPAIALTAYARFEDRTKALVAGFNMHVPKPVEPSELIAVMASLTRMFPRQ